MALKLAAIMKFQDTLDELRALATKDVAKVAERRGVPINSVLGVTTANIRKLSKQIGTNADLADDLWRSHYHEAKLLAVLIAPFLGDHRSNDWVIDVDSWDVCDQLAKRVSDVQPEILDLVTDWVNNDSLFVRRAGLALIANHCVKSTDLTDEKVEVFTGLIERASVDERQHVRQACCWALREFGKVNDHSHELATSLALELCESPNRASAWVGRCAYKELELLVKIPDRRRLISRGSKSAAKYVD